MTARRDRHVQLRMLSALALLLGALLVGAPASQTQGLGGSSPSKAPVLAEAYYGDIGVVSRLEGSAGGDQLVRVDVLAAFGNPSPTSTAWITAPRSSGRSVGVDVGDVQRARAPPSEEMT